MSVARCMAEVSSAEFTEWLAYSQIEHFGPLVEDLRAGVIAAAPYNVSRDRRAHPDPFGPRDVIPWLYEANRGGDEPILFDDPVAQTNYLRAQLFGGRKSG
ncbi:phage tail assembly protein T [Paraburkholderia tropica]|uniref:phage tail assembly protein T n=1 Tax=Paraburkholderia tropica TaxID=92647 RepID=UPI002AB7BA7D|nr:hypothetical protein [Paraburkholderia tropica]